MSPRPFVRRLDSQSRRRLELSMKEEIVNRGTPHDRGLTLQCTIEHQAATPEQSQPHKDCRLRIPRRWTHYKAWRRAPQYTVVDAHDRTAGRFKDAGSLEIGLILFKEALFVRCPWSPRNGLSVLDRVTVTCSCQGCDTGSS